LSGAPRRISRNGGSSRMEYLAIAMRCSRTGAPFNVILSRDDVRRKFRIADAIPLPLPSGSITSASGETLQAVATDVSMTDIDWSGYFCPICHHGSDGNGMYARCGKCGEFICGATFRQLPTGVWTFECYPDCGGGGSMNGEPVATVQATSVRAIGGTLS